MLSRTIVSGGVAATAVYFAILGVKTGLLLIASVTSFLIGGRIGFTSRGLSRMQLVTYILTLFMLRSGNAKECSRTESRHARQIINRLVMPRYLLVHAEMPASCPFSPANDQYAAQEVMKRRLGNSWMCSVCGKGYESERELELHLTDKHRVEQVTGCLAEHCDLLRCEPFFVHQTHTAGCNEADMLMLKHKCMDMIREQCLPSHMGSEAKLKLEVAVQASLCSYLTCEDYWTIPEEDDSGTHYYYTTYAAALSLVVCLYYGKAYSDSRYGQSRVPLATSSVGIPKLIGMMRAGEVKEGKADHRLTGASNIDEQLQEVMKYIFRDYIDIWYREISTDTRFPLELRKVLNSAIANFASRAKSIDWTPLLTHKLVDEMASHVKLYRRAYQQERKRSAEESSDGGEEQLDIKLIEKYFFEYETEMEEVCREAVSTDQQREIDYLQELVEMLLFFLLPDEEFDQRMLRFIIREVLVQGVICPMLDRISEPDYVNQYIIWMCYDTTLTSDSFIATLRMSNSIPEMQSVLAKVREDMSRARSKDTGGVDDSSIKQTLSSLSYLQRVCESQITRIATKSGTEEQCADVADSPSNRQLRSLPNKNLPLVFVLNNDLGIQYYNDFLLCSEREIYLNMLLDIESFNKEFSQQLDDKEEALTIFLNMVGIIYEKYFSEPVSTLEVDASCVEPVITSLREKVLNTSVFDALHDAIMEKLERFYEAFKKHDLYTKMLREMDLDIGCSLSEDSFDASAAADVATEGERQRPETRITATIVKTGIVKDKSIGSSYAVYSIQVKETSLESGALKRKWQTMRRYSDFYELYILICDKYVPLRDFPFPGKRTFNNLSTEFLEKRAVALTQYLQMVFDSEAYQVHTSLQQIMRDFLNDELWEKPKSPSHRKVGTLMFRPLKQSVKQMGTKFKAVPGDVLDGFGKMFTKLNFVPTMGKGQLDSYKVGASLDTEDDDNIPMRIMLLLLDEVFDLRKKNQWLRRRVVAILRQIVKATYGDRINRKIVDHVEMLTSADQVVEYIRNFKERLWPSGTPAEPSPERSEDTKLRTAVVCKAKMIGSVPDELRHLIGTETTRAGLMRVYNMFQHKSLNKRLIYVLMERVLQTLLPQNSLDKVFPQIHLSKTGPQADPFPSQAAA